MLDKPLSSLINDNKNNNKDINDLNDKKKIDDNIYHKYRKNLSNGVLYKFIFRQSYKYIMFVIVVFYFKFSLINQFRLFQNNSPMYCYCQNEILDEFKTIQIIGNIFLFSPFFKETYFSYDPFNIVYNEIFFFIFGTILIYLSYKNSLRLDIIILLLFMILEIGKFLVFYFLFNNDETKKFYPIMFFQSQTYKYILSNPFYNMSSMLMGLLFGMVNYCIQNNIKANENIKSFLKIPKSIIHLMKRNDFILFILVVFFLALLFASNFFFFFYLKENIKGEIIKDKEKKISEMNTFFTSYTVNLISLYDSDLGIIATFFLVIRIFLTGSNNILNFFSHQYWGIISRPYFTCILLIDLLSFLVFYQSENKLLFLY